MPRYRVEVTESTTTIREAWFDAPTPDEAKAQAESEDWREWEDVDTVTSCSVTDIQSFPTTEGE